MGDRPACDRAAKLQRVERLRRKIPHVSASALGAVLREVEENGVPEGIDRRTIREARDATVTEPTPYGTLVQRTDLPTSWGSIPLYFIHPCALFWHLCIVSVHFWTFLKERLAITASTIDRPWSLIAYSDEVTPGNVLATDTTRKSQVIYFSFKEFGPAALSREDLWFCFTEKLSNQCVKYAGGLARVFKFFLFCLFKGTHNFLDGIALKHGDEPSIRLYAKLGFIVQDGGAHKSVFLHKGDGGTNFCPLCLNAFAAASDVALYDAGLPSNLIKFADLRLATCQEIRDGCRRAQTRLPGETQEDWESRQQAVGWTAVPYSLLTDESLNDILDPAEQFMHDWMHGMLNNGVFSWCLLMLMQTLATCGLRGVYAELKVRIGQKR